VELAKDGPQGLEIVSTLEVITVGKDEDGEEISSCVVKAVEGSELTPSELPREPKLTPNEKTMFALLYDAGTAGLLTEDWNTKAWHAGIGARRRADLTDTRTGLKRKGKVREFADRWTVDHRS
jgi:hypothetical protein